MVLFVSQKHMWIICAIWGWEIWWSIRGKSLPIETQYIDQEIIKLSKKKKPRVLFLPTASWDDSWYVNNFKQYYSSLWCDVDILLLCNKFIDKNFIRNKILWSDIIYVWWWNTFKMIRIWKKTWIIPMLQSAYKKWVILSGISAWSICRFFAWLSDSRKDKNPQSDLIMVKWLNFINCYHSPHFDRDIKRRTQLPLKIKQTWWVYLALDDWVALLMQNNNYKIIKSKKTWNAYMYYMNNQTVEYKLIENDFFKPLKDIINFKI